MRVSTVDPRYALFTGDNRYRSAHGCLVGDGFIILHRQSNGPWKRRYDGPWETALCSVFGSRIARDLTRLRRCG
jgi:hypothetical protein